MSYVLTLWWERPDNTVQTRINVPDDESQTRRTSKHFDPHLQHIHISAAATTQN